MNIAVSLLLSSLIKWSVISLATVVIVIVLSYVINLASLTNFTITLIATYGILHIIYDWFVNMYVTNFNRDMQNHYEQTN